MRSWKQELSSRKSNSASARLVSSRSSNELCVCVCVCALCVHCVRDSGEVHLQFLCWIRAARSKDGQSLLKLPRGEERHVTRHATRRVSHVTVASTLSRHKESEGREQVCVRQRRRERERGGVQAETERGPTSKAPTLSRDQRAGWGSRQKGSRDRRDLEIERRGRGRAGWREGENSR
jgi:hypothetical protein